MHAPSPHVVQLMHQSSLPTLQRAIGVATAVHCAACATDRQTIERNLRRAAVHTLATARAQRGVLMPESAGGQDKRVQIRAAAAGLH